MNDDFFEGLIDLIESIIDFSEKSRTERIVIASVIGLVIFGVFCCLVFTYGWPG